MYVIKLAAAQNRLALELTDRSYRIGKSGLADVQERQLGLAASRVALLRVHNEAFFQRVNLHLALGGSFAPPVQVTATSNQEHEHAK